MGVRGIFAMLAGMVVTAAQAQIAQVERPPQFVMLAFDNCTELERWQDLSDFAAEMNRDGDRLHFTFFVSGINFIADAVRRQLHALVYHLGDFVAEDVSIDLVVWPAIDRVIVVGDRQILSEHKTVAVWCSIRSIRMEGVGVIREGWGSRQ